MKKLILIAMTLLISTAIFAQDKYFTKNGTITFDATSPSSPDKIAANNKSVTCVLDSKTGNVQFAVLMKGFEFERALMREHFHENYLESDKYPKAVFKGQITNATQDTYSKNGSYEVRVKGQMVLHGETREVETKGKITVDKGKITVSANFPVLLSDYKVLIPGLVSDKVAKTANIKVDCVLQALSI